MIVDETCTRFTEQLAAKQSTPGGGAAAAYAGALAVALGSMVGSFTTGKARYAEYEGTIQRLLDECERVRTRLLQLVDEDAAAFEPLAAAYAIPKEDPTRASMLEAATKEAIQAPLEMMRMTSLAVGILEELHACGSRMLISDVGCGAALAAGALRAAALNVFVNTRTLSDRVFADEVDTAADELLAEASRADALYGTVMNDMRNRE